MAIAFSCPACQSEYSVHDQNEGQIIICRHCQTRLRVPSISKPSHVIAEPLGANTPFDFLTEPAKTAPPLIKLAGGRFGQPAGRRAPATPGLVACKAFSILALVMALIGFFLPWTTLQLQFLGKTDLATQSGLQMIYGGGTLHPILAGNVGDRNREFQPEPKKRSDNQTIEDVEAKLKFAAPLLAVYPLLLGLVLLLLVVTQNPKRTAFIGFLGTANVLGILFVQFSIFGSPFAKIMMESGKGAFAILGAMMLDVSYTPWFFGSVAAVAIACGLQLVTISLPASRS